MKTSYVFGLLFLLCGLLPVSARAQEAPPVVISEINWAGSALSTADEWIELFNPTSESVDLSGWILTGSATSGDALALEDGTTIAANKTLLISNYPFEHEKTTLDTAPNLVTTSLSLPNSGLEIMLATSDGTVIDEATFTGTPDAGSTEPTASAQRNLDTLEFESATESFNLTDTTQLGSPGIVPDPTHTTSEPEPKPEQSTQAPEEGPPPTPPSQGGEAGEPTATESEQTEHDCPGNNTKNSEHMESETHPEPTEPEVKDSSPDSSEPEIPATDEPSQGSTTEQKPEQDPTSFTLGAILINEFVSNPEDGTEWIEFYNPGTEPVSLEGWFVTDATERATILDAISLEPGGYFVLENPSGKLNNSGDDVNLFDPSGQRIDFVSYGTELVDYPKNGESLSRDGDNWLTTDLITKGEENLFPTIPEEVAQEMYAPNEASTNEYELNQTAPTDDPLTDHTSPEQQTVSTSEPESKNESSSAPNAESETSQTSNEPKTHKVISVASSPTNKAPTKNSTSSTTTSKNNTQTFAGVVTALPGTFGDQVAFIDGVQVYSHFSDWPELTLGDVVRVTGEPSTSRGESRVKIKSANDVHITDSQADTANHLSVSDALSQNIGSLVAVTGHITERDGNILVLKDTTGELQIVAHNKTDINFDEIAQAQLTVSGVVRTLNGTTALYPRFMADIVEHAPAESDPVAKLVGATVSAPPNSSPWIGGGLALATAGGLVVLYMRKRNLFTNFTN